MQENNVPRDWKLISLDAEYSSGFDVTITEQFLSKVTCS